MGQHNHQTMITWSTLSLSGCMDTLRLHSCAVRPGSGRMYNILSRT